MTPAAYVECAARRGAPASRSSRPATPVEAVAARCGFGTVETMRRAFRRRLGVGPADYRARFTSTASRLTERSPMQIAIPLYDGFTALDAVGPYEVLSRMPGADVDFVGIEAGPYKTDNGDARRSCAEAALADVPQPGHLRGPRRLGHARRDVATSALVGWIRDAHETPVDDLGLHRLAAARRGRHARRPRGHDALARPRELAQLGAMPDRAARGEQGKVVTAAGVSSGIDMALTLAAKIAGDEVAQAIQLGIEYDPQPPFDPGSTEQGAAGDGRSRSATWRLRAAA